MKFMFKSVFLVSLVATQTQADPAMDTIDAVKWVQGCAALTQANGSADLVDSRCMANAVEYCEVRPRVEIPPCFDKLIDYWDKEARQIVETLPDGQNLTGFAKRRFESTKTRLTSSSYSPDCSHLDSLQDGAQKTELCSLFGSGSKWIELRSLERLAKKNERSEP